MGKRKKGGSHGKSPKRKTGKATEQDAEVTAAAEERYVEMRARGKTERDVRAVAVARGDEVLARFCDEIIDGTREDPMLSPTDDSDANASGEAVSGAEDADEPEAEASPAECRYVELRSEGKTPREILAVAESENDHDLFEYSDGIIRGVREEPEGECPNAGEVEGGENEGVGDDAEVAESDADATDADGDEGDGNSNNADGEDTPAEEDTRPMITPERLELVGMRLSDFVNTFRELSEGMSKLRTYLSELQRMYRAMGPATRKPRTPREPGAPRSPRGIGLLTAAANLLAENGLTMNCNSIVQTLDEKGIWRSPGGKTPWATLHTAIATEMKKGSQSRIVRKDKGQYAASEYGIALYQAAQANVTVDAGGDNDDQ